MGKWGFVGAGSNDSPLESKPRRGDEVMGSNRRSTALNLTKIRKKSTCSRADFHPLVKRGGGGPRAYTRIGEVKVPRFGSQIPGVL